MLKTRHFGTIGTVPVLLKPVTIHADRLFIPASFCAMRPGIQAMQLVEVNGMQFEVLPWSQRAAKLIADPLRNYLLPASFWQRVLRHSRSPLIAESFRRPGGWQSMRIVYANEPPVDLFDRMAVRSNPISMASRNRRKLIVSKLSEIVKSRAGESQLSIIGVGAGPGLHVQEAICQSGIEPARVKAYLIDRDSDAFEYGRQCARDRGIENCVSFVQGDAREIRRVLPHVEPQIVKVVGLLEYLTDDQALDLLRALREVMVPGAQILTHGIVDRYNTAPFVARTFGLKHVYRTGSQVRQMLETLGFHSIEMSQEPLKIYPILIARK
jgi:hypothetical protein